MLVSAALARSPRAPSALTLDATLDGRLVLITSPRCCKRSRRCSPARRLQKYLSAQEALRFITDLAAQTNLLADPPGPQPAVCRDPHDDYLIALATATGAGAIVTGDLDLLTIDPKQLTIEIVTRASSSTASADTAVSFVSSYDPTA